MDTDSIELSLLEEDERKQLEYIWELIPKQDCAGLQKNDILYVLDKVDDYMEENGLIDVDEETGKITYSDGEIDESEQLEYIINAAQTDGRCLTSTQVQMILDGELQYGIQQGWYEEE